MTQGQRLEFGRSTACAWQSVGTGSDAGCVCMLCWYERRWRLLSSGNN
ncbi:Uncharacterised protein [Bordetella pertussis]|nr:Uncharacterised protein [Bordetella pertussis]